MQNTKLSILVTILLAFGVTLIWKGLENSNQIPAQNFTAPSNGQTVNLNLVKVVRVVDGDTIEIEIDGQLKKLRYIGINTPETKDPRKGVECFGKEAENKNKELVEGKFVRLEKDVSETDKFGRLLRLVFFKVDDSEVFINDYLVRQGYAYADTYPPDVKFSERFRQAQQEARENNRGLWGQCFD